MKNSKIDTIIFDFGGVILDIDPQLTYNEFAKFGSKSFQEEDIKMITGKFERGILTPENFRSQMCEALGIKISDRQFDDAWNALLFDIPSERIEIIEKVKNNYNTLLLSNSNEIHYDLYVRDLQLRFGYREFDSLFNKAYFSFDTHLAKPDPDAFEFIINQHDLKPERTLFIDDSAENIAVAKQLGLKTYLLQKPERIRDIFRNGKLKTDLVFA
ncbi:MAG TPA: HAD family phosphatase [Bacteroidales bacterium]